MGSSAVEAAATAAAITALTRDKYRTFSHQDENQVTISIAHAEEKGMPMDEHKWCGVRLNNFRMCNTDDDDYDKIIEKIK